MITVAVCTGGESSPSAECLNALPADVRVYSAATLWEARSCALSECSVDVLALVDGDVVVPARWHERLREEWRGAPLEVAAIGGPIDAAPGLGGVDYGPDPLELDPLERTLFGGNLSFRRAALVGVGGLAPPVDGRDGVDWLSEEHEAQRQLGHWGWLERYVPDLRAVRLAPERPRIARRRFRYGVRQGIARSRPSGPAARQAAASAAGVPVALLRGDRAGASERAGRAAENAGLALAPLVARDAFRRGGAQARVDNPAPPGAARKWEPPALILLYHRVAAPPEDPLNLCVSPSHFRQQVARLAEALEIVAMDELAAERRPGTVALTFDDGYLDNLTDALPIVEEAGASMTLFAVTGRMRPGKEADSDQSELMSSAQAREFAARPGAELASHTRTHPSLAGLDRDAAWDEIAGSRADAAELRGGVPPRGFAYPFGLMRQNVDEQARRLAAEAGFDYAVVNQPVPVTREHDAFALPRLFAPDVPGDTLMAWLRSRVA